MTRYEDGQILCDACDVEIPPFDFIEDSALELDVTTQGVHVCRTCRRPEICGIETNGAEKWGRPQFFLKGNPVCNDWEFDHHYFVNDRESAEAGKEYLNECMASRRCILCLWNDGDYCTHEKAEVTLAWES